MIRMDTLLIIFMVAFLAVRLVLSLSMEIVHDIT